MENSKKWYDKFTRKPKQKKEKKIERVEKSEKPKRVFKAYGKPLEVLSHKKMFDENAIPEDAKKILLNFDDVIQSARPLNSKQFARLPQEIRALSHELTDEREDRRLSYMNETVRLSAYARYFLWWNFIRLTRLFSGSAFESLALRDGDICLDVGSGPLTVVIALWISRPELRKKKLTWYCLDISQGSLALGEEIFLKVASKTLSGMDFSPWKIIRVKGNIGETIKQKAALVTCANTLNEYLQRTNMPSDYNAKKCSDLLLSYTAEKASILIVEPGIPQSARLLSLMRDCFMRRNFFPLSPCPHYDACPMVGKKGGKWCNFAFTTDEAPAKLLKLSKLAGIPKERAVLSYLFVSNCGGKETKDEENSLKLRIASDPIRLPGSHNGFYACSDIGLVLAVNQTELEIASGDEIVVARLENIASLPIDEKSGAVEISI